MARRTSTALHGVFLLSGIAGLGYELVWVRMFAVGLGHEVPSLFGVVAAFFGGVATGAWSLDRPIRQSRVPSRWYAAFEGVMGVWALVSILLIPSVDSHLAHVIGLVPTPWRYWSIAFVVPFVVLLPATAAMGATLPAIEQLLTRLNADSRSVAGLYAVNTLGAVTGTLLTTFVLVPRVGFSTTLMLLAGVNVLCMLAVLAVVREHVPPENPPGDRSAGLSDAVSPVRLGVTLFLTGLFGIGYEVLGVRVMTQVLLNTVYSFAVALSAYLLGTALGAAIYRARCRSQRSVQVLTELLGALGAACVVGIILLSQSRPLLHLLQSWLGDSFPASIAAEFGLALIVFLVPCLLMGALFSHLAWMSRRETGGVGRALAVNTLGATLAPLVFGVWLLPAAGAKVGLMLIGFGYLLLAPRPTVRTFGWVSVSVALMLLVPARLVVVEGPLGGRVVAYQEGRLAAVAVVADADGRRLLKINNQYREGGSGAAFVERLEAHVPLLLHPAPRRALFLGVGTGATVGAASAHPSLTVDAVELLPEVVNMLPYFDDMSGAPEKTAATRLWTADARRYVAATDRQYDVVVADLFHPAIDGSGALYTREHFEAIRQRLAPGGLFCQWLPLYEMDLDVVRVIVKSFLAVYPESRAYLAYFVTAQPVLALVGTLEPTSYPADWWERRVDDPGLRAVLGGVGLDDGLSLLGRFLAGQRELATFVQTAALNTDNRPIVTFQAPRFTYRAYHARPAGYDVLVSLLSAFHPQASDLLTPDYPSAIGFPERLDRYFAARDVYLTGEIAESEGRTANALDLYLASIRDSGDFLSSHNATLRMIRTGGVGDPLRLRAARDALASTRR